jgi:hypothetical protein
LVLIIKLMFILQIPSTPESRSCWWSSPKRSGCEKLMFRTLPVN